MSPNAYPISSGEAPRETPINYPWKPSTTERHQRTSSRLVYGADLRRRITRFWRLSSRPIPEEALTNLPLLLPPVTGIALRNRDLQLDARDLQLDAQLAPQGQQELKLQGVAPGQPPRTRTRTPLGGLPGTLTGPPVVAGTLTSRPVPPGVGGAGPDPIGHPTRTNADMRNNGATQESQGGDGGLRNRPKMHASVVRKRREQNVNATKRLGRRGNKPEDSRKKLAMNEMLQLRTAATTTMESKRRLTNGDRVIIPLTPLLPRLPPLSLRITNNNITVTPLVLTPTRELETKPQRSSTSDGSTKRRIKLVRMQATTPTSMPKLMKNGKKPEGRNARRPPSLSELSPT
mmetsp:Transcript_7686/g.15450  ORF Transcript_7686/g.15450 Transcript_7686/m.15450 type:complete len:346 (-) Transcript_7686:87-1124(-)